MEAQAVCESGLELSHEDLSFLGALADSTPPAPDVHGTFSILLRKAARMAPLDALAVALATDRGWEALIGFVGPARGAFAASVRIEVEKACAAAARGAPGRGGVLTEVFEIGCAGQAPTGSGIGSREEYAAVRTPAYWAGMFSVSPGAFRRKHAVLLALAARRFRAYWRYVEAFNEITEAAAIDPLTGCRNRRWFWEQGMREVDRARRFGYPLCAGMIDLDGLKQVNDAWGHAAGDVFLRAAAKGLSDGFRRVDVFARYGGDEFAALLPYTPPDGSVLALARALEGCRRTVNACAAGGPLRGSVATAGVAVLREADDLESLIARADGALYAAKRDRRGSVALEQ